MKKKYVVLSLIGAAILIAIPSVLYVMGFRITYAPELENSWDAVSAFAAWAGIIVSIISVGVSGLAIYYAIQVPKKIADRQDKIALFEKRFAVYSEIQQIYAFATLVKEDIENETEKINLLKLLCATYAKSFYDHEDVTHFIHSILPIIKQIPLLFPNIDSKDYEELKQAFITLYCKNTFHETQNRSEIKESSSTILNFCNLYYKIFKECLSIGTENTEPTRR